MLRLAAVNGGLMIRKAFLCTVFFLCAHISTLFASEEIITRDSPFLLSSPVVSNKVESYPTDSKFKEGYLYRPTLKDEKPSESKHVTYEMTMADKAAIDSAFWTKCLAILAFLQGVMFFWQLYLMRLTMKESRLGMEKNDMESRVRLRSYVSMGLQSSYNIRNGEVLEGITVKLLLSNVGQTPAVIKDAFINIRIVGLGDELPDGGIDIIPENRLHVSLGNKEPEAFGMNYLSRSLIVDTYKKKRIFLFSVIRYHDVFETEHEIVRASEFIIRENPQIIEAQGRNWKSELESGLVSFNTVYNYGWST